MKSLLLILALLISTYTQAGVRVLFHPHDPTLETIAEWILQAQSTVDIAMYNMDVSDSSPVIQTLKSPQVQQRLLEKTLKIRMVFEGYATAAENTKRMQVIEALGIDVRFFRKSVKVHHKFAVIDTGLASHRVITGSANWSMASYRNYNENILFFDQEDEVSYRYQLEFNRLWNASTEFGLESGYLTILPSTYQNIDDAEIFFNSPRTIDKNSSEESDLTDQVVKMITGAQNEIQIATTRIRLVPILEALKAAAERGIRIKALISQDDYRDLYKRTDYLLKTPNLELRVKFYNLKVSNYIAFQMHNKFMIVDNAEVVTGSFNWSHSSEYSHIENIVRLSGNLYAQVKPTFQNEFALLWDMGRDEYPAVVEKLTELRDNNLPTPCGVPQMALNVIEIRQLIKLSPSCQRKPSPKLN